MIAGGKSAGGPSETYGITTRTRERQSVSVYLRKRITFCQPQIGGKQTQKKSKPLCAETHSRYSATKEVGGEMQSLEVGLEFSRSRPYGVASGHHDPHFRPDEARRPRRFTVCVLAGCLLGPLARKCTGRRRRLSSHADHLPRRLVDAESAPTDDAVTFGQGPACSSGDLAHASAAVEIAISEDDARVQDAGGETDAKLATRRRERRCCDSCFRDCEVLRRAKHLGFRGREKLHQLLRVRRKAHPVVADNKL